MSKLHGRVYRLAGSNKSIGPSAFQKIRGITYNNGLRKGHWHSFTLSLLEPLSDHDLPTTGLYVSRDEEPDSFLYSIWILKSPEKLALVGESPLVLDYIASSLEAGILAVGLYPQPINVDRLIETIYVEGGPYTVSFIHVRTGIDGAKLRSISMYGDDVIGAELFIQNKKYFDVLSAGLGKIIGNEVLRIHAKGEFSLSSSNSSSFELATEFLIYLNEKDLYLNFSGE